MSLLVLLSNFLDFLKKNFFYGIMVQEITDIRIMFTDIGIYLVPVLSILVTSWLAYYYRCMQHGSSTTISY